MFYEVAPTGKVEKLIYGSDDPLSPGQIVLVPLGKRKTPAVIIKKVAQPNFPCKKILQVLYAKPLPTHLVKTIDFLHTYYLAASGAAASLILPIGVERKRRKTEQMFGKSTETEHPTKFPEIPLNTAQKNALKALQKAPGATKLLFGVTGSGKTNIYLKMALNAFKQQKSTILLVPEIALTSQLVRVFQEVFGQNVVLIHSKQTEAERHLIFNYLLDSNTPKIVIGPRSALFAPLNNLGLIVIDEEHESSYYQDNSPHYSAIRVASFMAKTLDIPLILGSATPKVEDYYLASQHFSLVQLTKKALPAAKPEIWLLGVGGNKNRYFSDKLLDSISDNLAKGYQTLIFHNRRGSSPLTICERCGEEILCPNCYLPLTLHADRYELVCHTCNHHEKVPTNCPKCSTPGIVHKGFGTKLLENELTRLFPKAVVHRFDRDNKKGEGLDALYDEVKSGKTDILIGTQTIAKGLDLPKLATVGVVQADAGINLPDFSAEERTFELLTQVIGRVGRGHLDKAEVIIQTFNSRENPLLEYAMKGDYFAAANYLLEKRKKANFPPFSFVAKLEITLKTEKTVLTKVRTAINTLIKNKDLLVSPPMPSFHERTNKGYTWQIILRSKSRKALLEACQNLDSNFKITLDPPSLL